MRTRFAGPYRPESLSETGLWGPFSANKSDPIKGSFLLAGFYGVGFERELGPHRCRAAATLGTILRQQLP